jgi:RNA polymerase sigma-70 factor (ECF subfamily)
VAKRIEALPERQREVLLLRYYQQMSEREIAEVVGIPPGTVKSRLHTAIRRLRSAEEKSHGA